MATAIAIPKGAHTVDIQVRCTICGDTHTIHDVPIEGYTRWVFGELIQRALPELSANDRELLISGICPTCWDEMFEPH